MPQQHQDIQGRPGKPIFGHVSRNDLVKLIVRVEKVQYELDRRPVEARVARSGPAHTLVIKGLATVLVHRSSIRMKLVKFLIIFGATVSLLIPRGSPLRPVGPPRSL